MTAQTRLPLQIENGKKTRTREIRVDGRWRACALRRYDEAMAHPTRRQTLRWLARKQP